MLHRFPVVCGHGGRIRSLFKLTPSVSRASSSATLLPPRRDAMTGGLVRRLREHLLSEGNGGRRLVGYWLVGSSAAVFGIIVLGGLTRLTESGLSMVDWKLVHFAPPATEADWQAYFEKYQAYPEYKLNNRDMTLSEFKRIYHMEHLHRVCGRMLGLAIIGPSILFCVKNWVSPRNKRILIASSLLVVFQGLLGWHMVKSGLREEIVERREAARVSAYRLAAHLGSAFALYALLLNSAINILSRPTVGARVPLAVLKRLKSQSHSLASLVLVTALSGAFVAGLDAGLIYNEFPLMGGRLLPSDLWIAPLGWRNPFENPTCAQFVHRVLAITTLSAVTVFWWRSRRLPLPPSIRTLGNGMMGVAWAQGTLGVLTLLHEVPVPLASTHQAGSVTLLTFALWLVNRLKYLA